SCWKFMGTPFRRVLGRVLGTTRGRGSVGAPQAAFPTAYSWGAARCVCGGVLGKLRGSGWRSPSICDRPLLHRAGPRAARSGQSRGTQEGGASMTASAPLSFDQSREQVEAMMEQGTAFSDVEDVIDAGDFSTVHK